MHPDHELSGRLPKARLTGRSRGHALLRAIITGTLLTTFLWIVLVMSSQTINQVYLVLLLMGPIWIISTALFYRASRR